MSSYSSIEANNTKQVRTFFVRSSWPDFLPRGYFAPSGPSKARSSVWERGLFYERADPAHGFDKGAGLRSGRSKPRVEISVGIKSRDRRRSSELPQAGISDPIFVFGSGEWHDTRVRFRWRLSWT